MQFVLHIIFFFYLHVVYFSLISFMKSFLVEWLFLKLVFKNDWLGLIFLWCLEYFLHQVSSKHFRVLLRLFQCIRSLFLFEYVIIKISVQHNGFQSSVYKIKDKKLVTFRLVLEGLKREQCYKCNKFLTSW